MRFEITTGPTRNGWCDFTVRIDSASWKCQASYIGEYPLNPLVHSAVNLYCHIFVDPIPLENAFCDSIIADEPGGILLRATPSGENVNLHIYVDTEDAFAYGDPRVAERELVASSCINYWEYAEAIYRDLGRAISRQGIIGLRSGWSGEQKWGFDFEFNILPLEQVLYLAFLLRDRAAPSDSSFWDELAILGEMVQKNDN